jgi:hypothetical protein
MNVSELIEILKTLDGDADVTLGIDRETEDGDFETDLVPLTIDDVALGNSYVAFQVPSERSFDHDEE